MVKQKLTQILIDTTAELGRDRSNKLFDYISETMPKKQYYTQTGAIKYFERETKKWINFSKEVLDAKVIDKKYGYFHLN